MEQSRRNRQKRRTNRLLAALIPWLFFMAAIIVQQIELSRRGAWMGTVETRLQQLESGIK